MGQMLSWAGAIGTHGGSLRTQRVSAGEDGCRVGSERGGGEGVHRRYGDGPRHESSARVAAMEVCDIEMRDTWLAHPQLCSSSF